MWGKKILLALYLIKTYLIYPSQIENKDMGLMKAKVHISGPIPAVQVVQQPMQ